MAHRSPAFHLQVEQLKLGEASEPAEPPAGGGAEGGSSSLKGSFSDSFSAATRKFRKARAIDACQDTQRARDAPEFGGR